ncbi:uncharacterized protein LOC144553163 [Carex rostrata]
MERNMKFALLSPSISWYFLWYIAHRLKDVLTFEGISLKRNHPRTCIRYCKLSDLEANGSAAPSSPKTATRGKTDPAWGHCVERIVVAKDKNVKVIACLHCEKTFQGGSITQFKKHLACVKGDVQPCKKVPGEVCFQMQHNIEEFANKRRRFNEVDEEMNSDEEQPPIDLTNDKEEIGNPSTPSRSRPKGRRIAFNVRQLNASHKRSEVVTRKAKLGVGESFMPRRLVPHLRVSDWMVDAGVPFNDMYQGASITEWHFT